VALSKKEDKKMVWITITTSSKKEKIVREIAAKNKDEADTWVARLTQASGGKAAAAPSVKEKVTEEKPAKVETKVKDKEEKKC